MRFVGTTVTGLSHAMAGSECQDFHVVRRCNVHGHGSGLLAVVSDGASMARFGAQGARTVCETVAAMAAPDLREGFPTPTHARQWVAGARAALHELARAHGTPAFEWSATLVGTIWTPGRALFFQIGDGAIVTRRADALAVVFWPMNGAASNQTWFVVSPDAMERLAISELTAALDGIALMSDGVQVLGLSESQRAPLREFFGPMFRALDTAADGIKLQQSLADFLRHPNVCARTPDDKTLVLLGREPAG